MKVALITGITGQDGSYLSRIFVKKRICSSCNKEKIVSFNTDRIESFV